MTTENMNRESECRMVDENRQAENYITSGDLKSAAGILVKIVDEDNENWRAFNNMGVISWAQEAWEDAFTMFKKSVSLKPDYLDALMNLFDAALRLKRVNETLPLFKKALEINPELEEIKVIVDGIEQEGDDIYSSEHALKIGTFNPRVEEAKKKLKDGKINEAMQEFLDINDSEGPNAEVYCGLGIISYYQKRYKDAFSLFVESIKLNPADTDTFLNMMDAAKECGLESEAKKIYDEYSKHISILKAIEENFK